LEYDFIVAPGADLGAVQLSFDGAQSMQLDSQNNLVIQTAGGQLVEQAPLFSQVVGGSTQTVSGQYLLTGANQIGIQADSYNPTLALNVDPVLVYSSYLGGSGDDSGLGSAVDGAGNLYVT